MKRVFFTLPISLMLSCGILRSQAQVQADPWPDGPQKQQVLQRAAELMRTILVTQNLEKQKQALKDTQAEVRLKYLQEQATAFLNEGASLLSSKELISTGRYMARLDLSTNMYLWVFWSEDLPLQQFEKRTADGQRVYARACFHQNGNLKEFSMAAPDKDGIHQSTAILTFKEDGTLDLHWVREGQIRVK